MTKRRSKPSTAAATSESPSEQERVQACGQAINEALERYGCKLTAAPALVPDGIGGFRMVISHIGCAPAGPSQAG